MSKKQILQKTKLSISANTPAKMPAIALKNTFAKSLPKQKPLIQILSKPKILTLLFYALFTVFGLFVLGVSPIFANQTKPDPAIFPQYECTEPKKFSKTQRDNIIYAYNFGAPHGMGYTLAAIAWQESCAGVYMMNFSDPSAGLYHAHIPVVLKYYSKYEDNAFTRNVMGQMLIDNRLFASQIALDTLLYWQKYHKGNHKNTIKSYNKGFKWQKDKENNTLAESYYNSVSKKMRALETYIPRYSRVKNQSLFVELEDKNKHLEQTFRTLQNAKKIEKKAEQPKQPQKQESNLAPSTKSNTINTTTTQKTPAQSTQTTQSAQTTQPAKSTNQPKEQESTKDITKQPKKPPIKPFIEPKKDAPKQGLDNDDFIELPITPLGIDELSKKTKLANNQTNNANASTSTRTNPSTNARPQNRSNQANNANQLSQKIQKLDELFDDFNLIFEGN